MAQTVSELVVKVTDRGVEETTENLERQTDAFDEAAGTASGVSGMLDKFSKRFTNSMAAVAGGLAIAVSGLLAGVPVVKESMGALGLVLDSIQFRIDEQLRPAMNRLNQDLIELSNAIFSAEGEFDAILQVVGRVASMIGERLPGPIGDIIQLSGLLLMNWDRVWEGIQRRVSSVTSRVLGTLNSWRETVLQGWRLLTDLLTVDWDTAMNWIVTRVQSLLGDVNRIFKNLRRDILGIFENVVSDAFRSGRSIVNSLISGLRSRLSSLRDMANRVADAVRSYLPGSDARVGPLQDMTDIGPSLVDTLASGMDARLPRIERSSARVATAARPEPTRTGGGGGGGMGGAERQFAKLVAAMQNSQVSHTFEVDGRELARSVTPLVGEDAVRSGATGVRR